eukprot:scaffold314762_cov32-Tisochrysis_lutea.AAC.4
MANQPNVKCQLPPPGPLCSLTGGISGRTKGIGATTIQDASHLVQGWGLSILIGESAERDA